MQLRVTARQEDGTSLPILIVALETPLLAISSAPLGGGLGLRNWVISATVHKSYSRMNPEAHLAELAEANGCVGAGVGFLTAVDVTERKIAVEAGVDAVVTVGLGVPTWASAPDETPVVTPGTINSVVRVPVRLSDAALVNAVMTATEAKTQALFDAGVAATGTASDAVCVLCPPDGDVEAFGGPRSTWGARIARAVYQATRAGADEWCQRREVS
jgi:adenosylcobinamide hydrolase